MNHLDTIVAISTPPGTGAVAMIRVSGQTAFDIVQKLWKGKPIRQMKSHTVHLGSFHELNGKQIDECLIAIFRAPNSYTREDTIELSCHGSSYIQQQILNTFVQAGARLAGPGEFTMRSFLNGRMDLSQAEAVADLIHAEQEQAHDNAIKQMRGGFGKDLQALRDELLGFVALMELELDFGEEDVEFAQRDQLKALVLRMNQFIQGMINSFDLGNVMKNGVAITIAGRPNAGKSTLLNALLNEERAIVSEIAGTTRDTIDERLVIKGILFRITDTAGIRDTTDVVEGIGVERAIDKAQKASMVLYVFDVLNTSPADIIEDIKLLNIDSSKILLLANKMDKNPYTKPEEFIPDFMTADQIVSISAINGMNVPYLKERLYNQVMGGFTDADTSIVTNARHKEALEKSKEALNKLIKGMEIGLSGDLLAMEAREAMYQLGTITGQVDVEELLGNIFGRFCIGK